MFVDNRTCVPVRSGVIHHDNGETLSLPFDKEKSLFAPNELAAQRRCCFCVLFYSFPTRSKCFAGWESLNSQGPAAESQRDNSDRPDSADNLPSAYPPGVLSEVDLFVKKEAVNRELTNTLMLFFSSCVILQQGSPTLNNS